MTVTHPKGFRAAGIRAGLKNGDAKDLTLIVNDGPHRGDQIVFTKNRSKANPILWSEKVSVRGPANAIILNSGGANCFTGHAGYQTTRRTAEMVARELHGVQTSAGKTKDADPFDKNENPFLTEVPGADHILVCSTGIIGVAEKKFEEAITAGIPALVKALNRGEKADRDAAEGILTTDSHTKTALHQADGWSIGAIAKGAGMLAPGLATMLVVITTDAKLSCAQLRAPLEHAVERSFNRLDSDGCMSTNDQVTLMASGASEKTPSEEEFTQALTEVCDTLAKALQDDAEGASHNIDILVNGAATEQDAVTVARAVARNNLFKTAIYGNDPNWGRVLAAIGTTEAKFDPYRVDVSFNEVRLCHAGAPDRDPAECDLTPKHTRVLIDLKAGMANALIRTNDLTKEYVHENSAYSS